MPTLYKSTDSSAPVLRGVAGDFIALLDAILVNGYGAKSAAWGASQKKYSGTNLAAYQQPAGSGLYLRVDDTTTTYASVRGYENMVDITDANSTNGFPNSVNPCYAGKSLTADTTARPWYAIADDKRLFLFVKGGANVTGTWEGFFFGDITSNITSDAFGCALVARSVNTTGVNSTIHTLVTSLSSSTASTHFMARAYDQSTKSINFGKIANPALNNHTTTGKAATAQLTYPHVADSKLYIHPILVIESIVDECVRGTFPWCYDILHAAANFTDEDTFSIGAAGYTILAVGSSASDGRIAVQTSGW